MVLFSRALLRRRSKVGFYRSIRRASSAGTNKSIYVFGSCDSKQAEVRYLRNLIANKLCKWSEPCVADTSVKCVDTSTSKCVTFSDTDHNSDGQLHVDMTCRDLVPQFDTIRALDRNASAEVMSKHLHAFIAQEHAGGRVSGVIGVGGSMGTALTSSAFSKQLPLGLPKIVISTVAASPLAPDYIGCSDLILMPSVADICGLSNIYKTIAENAASSIVGMAQNYRLNELEKQYAPQLHSGSSKVTTVAMSMFGITTKCVEYVRAKLHDKYGDAVHVLVFHVTGTGGKCMEYLIDNGFVDACIDITTTEIADYVAGGILSCDALRLNAAKQRNIPTIVSLGAANVVNFGAPSSISSALGNDETRVWHKHNEQVTLMKANEQELQDIAGFIADKLNEYNPESVRMLIPSKGISALDANDSTSSFAPFARGDLDILTSTLKSAIKDEQIIQSVDAHINDEPFAQSVVDVFDTLLQKANVDVSRLKSVARDGRNQAPNSKPKVLVSGNFSSTESRRHQIMSSLYEKLKRRQPVIGCGAGTGISAKYEVAGGSDLIIVYNSGKYRMAGRGSLAGLLAFGDANEIVQQMANEVIPIVRQQNEDVAVIAGVNGTDPFKDMHRFLGDIKALGFDGVQNFPTVGLIDGKFRTNCEETGFGYDKEVECMKIAKNEFDLITTPYVFDVAQCASMAEIGVDIVVIHMGLTVGGSIGAKTVGMNLDECCEKIQVMANAIQSINPNQIILVHGGPIATPSDVKYVLDTLPKGTIDGFYGASSMERLPVETAITETVREFTELKL